jgi:hypothetical protein
MGSRARRAAASTPPVARARLRSSQPMAVDGAAAAPPCDEQPWAGAARGGGSCTVKMPKSAEALVCDSAGKTCRPVRVRRQQREGWGARRGEGRRGARRRLALERNAASMRFTGWRNLVVARATTHPSASSGTGGSTQASA